MYVSEDGTVTGSIDVSKLDEIKPRTDEAKAQIASLKAEVQAGQEQAARDARRLAEQAQQQDVQLRGGSGSAQPDTRDAQGKELEGRPQGGAVQQQSEANPAGEQDVRALQAEAESAGVTVDKRWGADRLRQEIDQAKSSRKQR